MSESSIQLLVERLGRLLVLGRHKLVTAESCTGGGIASMLTSIAGSSQWFDRGFVTYSNIAKEEMLSVSAAILTKYGAVSEQTAAAMATGALIHSPADFSVSVTGIAGPDGGTKDKPVGTVCFGWCSRGGQSKTARIQFSGDRRAVRDQTVAMAIQGLLDLVETKQ